MNRKLDHQTKNLITTDWSRRFPDFGVYRPMWLLRRNGPLLQGIALERNIGNDAYCPTLHIHSLTSPSPSVTLSLNRLLRTERTNTQDWIKAGSHDTSWREASNRLERQSQLPLHGDLLLKDLMNAYADFIGSPQGQYVVRFLEDTILIMCWCGQTRGAQSLLRSILEDYYHWPSDVMSNIADIEQWTTNLKNQISNPEIVRTAVEQQVVRLKVANVPVFNLICE